MKAEIIYYLFAFTFGLFATLLWGSAHPVFVIIYGFLISIVSTGVFWACYELTSLVTSPRK